MTDEAESGREAMVRWQQYARESRTAANSHFLAYAAAIVALQASILMDENTLRIQASCIFSIGGFFALLSLSIGSAVVLIRLRDAGLTAKIARYKYSDIHRADVDRLRETTRCLGAWTNTLIPCQVISFMAAAVLFCLWIVIAFGAKL